MVSVKLDEHQQPAQSTGPPRWARAIIYAIVWLPLFWELIIIVPRFEPVFNKLADQGAMPSSTGWLMALVREDAAWYHVPALLAVVGLLALDETAMRRLRARPRGMFWAWVWVVAVALAGVACQVMIVVLLLLPAFKMAAAAS